MTGGEAGLPDRPHAATPFEPTYYRLYGTMSSVVCR